MSEETQKRGPNKLPYGMVATVSRKLKINKQNAWRKIHVAHDPEAIEIVNQEIRKINKKRKEGLKKYEELKLLISES